jgi:hypothetical protein
MQITSTQTVAPPDLTKLGLDQAAPKKLKKVFLFSEIDKLYFRQKRN